MNLLCPGCGHMLTLTDVQGFLEKYKTHVTISCVNCGSITEFSDKGIKKMRKKNNEIVKRYNSWR